MYIQMFANLNDKEIEEKYKSLSSEQKLELLKEIKTQREDLEKQKLVCDTKVKSLQDSISDLMKELKEKFDINTIEEAVSRMKELDDEIVTSLTEFIKAIPNK